MKYNNWNKRQLNEQLNLSYDLFNISQTEDFAHAIYTLNSLLSNSPNIFPLEQGFDKQVENDQDEIKNNKLFIPSIETFSKLNDMYKKSTIGMLTDRYIPKNILLSYTHDFYHSIDKDLAKYFDKVFKERHNNLRITNKDKAGYDHNYSYYIPTLKYGYINLHTTDTIADFTGLIHEYAHIIAEQIKFRSDNSNYPFVELLPLLMEEIATHEIAEEFEDLDQDCANKSALLTKTVLNYSKELISQIDFYNIVDSGLDRKDFIELFREHSNNTIKKSNKIFNISIKEKLTYVIPYLVMVELYYMYYDDPDKALFILKKLLEMDETDNYLSYLYDSGIHLNEHTKDFVKTQNKRIKLTRNV